MTSASASHVIQVPVDRIHPGRVQARRRFDETALLALAASLRESGVVQPVVLRSDGEGYELLAGERRWRAAQLAGLQHLPALIRDDLDDGQAQILGLVENLQRESLSPMETATGLDRLARSLGLTHEAVAQRIGKSRAYVSNCLRLLDLAPEVAALVDDGALSLGHAKALAALPEGRQRRLAREAIAGRRSVRWLERRAAGDAERRPIATDGDHKRLERELSEQLGYAARILTEPDGGGELRLRFASLDELDGLLARIGWREDE
jgi:ParB-like partition proteins